MKKYETEAEILAVVREFENGTINRADWHHAEHLTVAFYYAFHSDFETALTKMRDGIFKLLRAFEVDFSKEMPYHETLTVFWLRIIFELKESRQTDSFINLANLVQKAGADKDLPLQFYSRDFLFSDEARKKFIEGDLH